MTKKTPGPETACLPSAFIAAAPPFSELPPGEAALVAETARVDFCPAGERLFSPGERVDDFLLVQSGGVGLTTPEGVALEYFGPGQAPGASELFADRPARGVATALEDTFHYRLDGGLIRDLARVFPEVRAYYCERFPALHLERALARLRRDRGGGPGTGSRPLFALSVGEVARFPVVDIPGEASIVAAAARMADHGVGSILLRDEAGGLAGIVTDRDFRYKVLARGGDITRPVREIMSSPVCVVDHREACFGALTVMMQRRVHHLAVERDGAVAGMVTSHDILALQGRSPFSLFADVEAARDVSSLTGLLARIPRTARALLEDGAGAAHVGRVVSMIWDAVLERILTLIQGELGPPPVPFCWLALGDAGRMEQVPGSPPDGVVVYQEPSAGEAVRCRDYFAGFAQLALGHVRTVAQGASPGPGPDGVASLSFEEWQAFFVGHAAAGRPDGAGLALALCDARPVFGYLEMGKRLCAQFRQRAKGDQGLLGRLAATLFPTPPPLAVYGGEVLDAAGQGTGFFDVTGRGLSPLTGTITLATLAHGLSGTQTLSRLTALRDAGYLAPETWGRLATAVDYLMHLRLANRLRQARSGRPGTEMDDLMPGTDLDPLAARMLTDVFAAMAEADTWLTDRFGPGREGE